MPCHDGRTDIPVEVLNWWQDHCKLDRKHGEPRPEAAERRVLRAKR